MTIRKAIIPAAGLGTRFLPFTKAMPKEMLNIVDKPAIQYNVEELVRSGIEDILIITARNKEAIVNHFDVTPELDEVLRRDQKEDLLQISTEVSDLGPIHFVRQGTAKGLGHAVLCGEQFVGGEPFVVLLGDDLFYNDDLDATKQLMEIHEKTGACVIGVMEIPLEYSYRYGIVQLEEEDGLQKITHMVEKPKPEHAPSNLAVVGRYLLTPEIFDALRRIPRGKGGEFQLTDAIEQLIKEGHLVCACELQGRRYDTGDKLGYLEATVEYALRHPELKDSFKDFLDQRTS